MLMPLTSDIHLYDIPGQNVKFNDLPGLNVKIPDWLLNKHTLDKDFGPIYSKCEYSNTCVGQSRY